MTDLNDRLRKINIENFVWVIYFILIGLCIYSNEFEKDYLLTSNNKSKETYRNITITIFSVALIIYLYFVYDGIKEVNGLNCNDSSRKKIFSYSSLTGSILVLISGIIFLSIAIADTELDAEIAFN